MMFHGRNCVFWKLCKWIHYQNHIMRSFSPVTRIHFKKFHRKARLSQEKRTKPTNYINHVCYLIIAPRIKGMVSIWNVSRQPSLSTKEPVLKLPINAPAINILTTSPSMKEFPSNPSSRAMETMGPFMTLQNMESSFKPFARG